jgi:beta-lactam-binding protein with PASTA domain
VVSLSPGAVTTTTYPSLVEIPNVIGLALSTAMGRLRNKVTAHVTHVHSASVTAGHVISVTPGPGSSVSGGQVVIVVSSLGPG